jgi:hypothetical protein
MQKYLALIFLFASVCISSCGVYSLTGASISPDIKTVTIQYFQNRASLVQPALSQKFTEKLKDKFVSQTNLRLIDSNGDLLFEGQINDYRTQPVAIQGTQTAALTRLTITVNVKFTNAKDAKQNFETSFTRYADYDSQKSLTEVELNLIDEINKQLVDDIFNKAVSNW